jgi:uncharacterized protein
MGARMLSAVLAALLASGGRAAVAQPPGPSFDCGRARMPDEIAICNDPRLAELDQAVAIGMGAVAPMYQPSARSIAKEALAARNSCGSNRLCILDQQVSAIERFAEFGSHVPVPPWVGSYRLVLFGARTEPRSTGLPHRVGQCSITKIASVSTRFGEELKRPTRTPDSAGSAVSYANKGYQVTYSFIEAIAASRIGDEALLCLVSVPKNCPPGDDRGRIYAATNLRTKGTWVLPDAQHMCGGA